MWCHPRMEKISWSDRISKEEVLERVNERKSIWNSIQKRQSKLIGQILRHHGLLLIMLKGIIDGKIFY